MQVTEKAVANSADSPAPLDLNQVEAKTEGHPLSRSHDDAIATSQMSNDPPPDGTQSPMALVFRLALSMCLPPSPLV